MEFSRELIDFINNHINDNTSELLLNARKYPNIDISFAVDQIISKNQLKNKLPLWYECSEVLYPSKISTEQCSSQETAYYKQSLIKGDSLCDLTGGLGVDSYFFSLKTKKSIYVERFESYCEFAKHNFESLKASNITVVNSECSEYLNQLEFADTIYIDPARRSDVNKRLFALDECEPNILSLKQEILSKCQRLIIKISPMADIKESLRLLPETTEVHVVSLNNECKELLFVLEKESNISPKIYCVNIKKKDNEIFDFDYELEKNLSLSYENTPYKYLYEPNTSVLKAGAFKSIAQKYNLNKVSINSHIYTSDKLEENFPGRIFKINEIIEFSSKNIKSLNKKYPKANITVRNFFLSVAQIREKTKIKEGGDVYIFATTLNNQKRVLLECSKIN